MRAIKFVHAADLMSGIGHLQNVVSQVLDHPVDLQHLPLRTRLQDLRILRGTQKYLCRVVRHLILALQLI